ncbi:MAG: ABC transporter substrate-binding protein [Lachnospiraceae bacterium]|nr:ABC transporter substrate-binding protein [Lachnospiraceae bacterium]
MKRKAIALILAASMAALALTGCGGGSAASSSSEAAPAAETAVAAPAAEAGTAAEGASAQIQTEATSDDVVSAQVDVFNIASDRDPTDLGPWAGNMGGASAQIPVVYQTLMIMELNKDWEPCLAKSVTKVDDKTYDVELFDYITDSEGNKLTSSDIVFGVETAKSIGRVAATKVVESIEVKDDYNFTVHFSDNFAMGDDQGFFCQTFFVTQASYEAEGNGMSQHPIGTGPYKLKEYVGGSVISFEKRDDYWQTDAQYIARSSEAHADLINFQIITEATQRAIAIENGSLDYGSVALNDKQRLESEGYGIVPVPDNLTYMMFMNMDPASDVAGSKELRQALYYALDNAQIAALYTSADAVPVYDISNSNYTDYYEEEYKAEDNYYQYDIAKAQDLLKASGYDTSKPLKLICSSDQGSIEIAEIIKTFWQPLGINVEIESYQGNLMSDIAADPANWDVYLLQYASTDYAVNVWEKVLNKAKYAWGGTINFVMDEEVQNQLALVRTADGHTKENVIAMHDYLVDQAWCMGLVQGIQYYACSDKLDVNNVVMSDQRIIRPNATIFK